MTTVDMTFTRNGSIFTFSADKAPKDTNGNLRIDIMVIKDGKEYRETIKGFRKVKAGYRTQLGAHGYSHQEAIEDLFKAIKALERKEEEERLKKDPRKSNSYQTVQLIRKYIIDNLSEDETTDLKEQLYNVTQGFKRWYGTYEQRRTPNLQDAFSVWLKCLPSELYATPYNQEQSELLCDWMNTHGRSYSVEATNKLFYALLYREFNKLCAGKGVDPIFKAIIFKSIY